MNKMYLIFIFIILFQGCNLNNPFQDTIISPTQELTPEPTPVVAKWIAYNDCVESTSGNAPNITEFNFNNTTGTLMKYGDGTATSVNVQISASNIIEWLGSIPLAGTDAYSIFNGIININESASYYLEADWFYEITFTGLNPLTEYEFITTVNRNEVTYAGNRWTKFTISGADTCTNISSTGVIVVSEDILKMDTGYNTVNGYVIGWSGITASDGTFTVRSENVGAEGPGELYKSYGFQGFVLKEF
ncbi:MAG: hypothetical protein JXB88_18555 [Spirochaetales bacterium]|nr:hypothetical protein [Spirochaetales bacterium]